MLHPVALLLSLRKTRPLMLQRLCFLLAVWQHLYWKAQNCWTRVYTVPPLPYTLRQTHKHAHTRTRTLICTQPQFKQAIFCLSVIGWVWAMLRGGTKCDISYYMCVRRCLRVSFCFVRTAASDWQQTYRCQGDGSCRIECFSRMEELLTHAAHGIWQMCNNAGVRQSWIHCNARN